MAFTRLHNGVLTLDTDVQYVKGVGPRFAEAFRKLGIATVRDMLFTVPRRYEDRRHTPPIREVQDGQWVTLRGRIVNVDTRPIRGGRVIISTRLRDSSGSITLTWFNQAWVARQLEAVKASEIVVYGQVKGHGPDREIAAPEWEAIEQDDDVAAFATLTPVYGLTQGLPQKVMRRAVDSALAAVDLLPDPLPRPFRERHRLMGLRHAITQLHRPEDPERRAAAHRRLVFEEFFYLQAHLALRRAANTAEAGIAFPIEGLPAAAPAGHLFASEDAAGARDGDLESLIRKMLPFELTNAQKRVLGEIFRDMAAPFPMNRLVQGDVGSGKTAVAACAMLAAVRAGYQAALMAPTEILAEQHAVNLRRLFAPLGITVALLVGKLGVRQKRSELQAVATGSAQIAVGTHALIQDGVEFPRLGLAIIDEQHRFGVRQRLALRQKGQVMPDTLVMTATPIPRTLSMAFYGDLDQSKIDELPPGRTPIKTHWKSPADRETVYETVRGLVEKGRQAYFVCPLVSDTEKMNAQAAEELHRHLSETVFDGIPVGLLHGQMKPAEKEFVMERFRTGELRIMVSTTVIEVGVDVPNASVMVIEDANRFGLAQLHQLRGRVGRGSTQSFCVLIAEATNEDTRERMETMVASTDGFRIAEKDLEMRGPGVMAGTLQAGNADFKFGDLIRDAALLEEAREAAREALPELDDLLWQDARPRIQQISSESAMITVS